MSITWGHCHGNWCGSVQRGGWGVGMLWPSPTLFWLECCNFLLRSSSLLLRPLLPSPPSKPLHSTAKVFQSVILCFRLFLLKSSCTALSCSPPPHPPTPPLFRESCLRAAVDGWSGLPGCGGAYDVGLVCLAPGLRPCSLSLSDALSAVKVQTRGLKRSSCIHESPL